jgi:hypothetical protein
LLDLSAIKNPQSQIENHLAASFEMSGLTKSLELRGLRARLPRSLCQSSTGKRPGSQEERKKSQSKRQKGR